MISSLGYGARVWQQIETNPNAGGGPIRRTPLIATPANAGNFIQRSPHKMIPDPGHIDEPQLLTQKFLPDGRLVADHAFGAPLPQRTRVALFGGAMTLLGAGLGVWLAGYGERGKGALTGGLIGLGASAIGALGGSE